VKRPSRAAVLRAMPAPAAALTQALLDAADARDLRVHLVGGPVRDLLLGRPVRDVDLVVEDAARGAALGLAHAAAPEAARVTAHERFGTVSLDTGEARIDLATARSESYAHDGALPSVGEGSLEEDLRRRDFSVNALALPLSRAARAAHPAIVDVEGGLDDLATRRLRILHPRSFHDDPTRAWRAARFAARLGFKLDRGSRAALRSALRDGAFAAERHGGRRILRRRRPRGTVRPDGVLAEFLKHNQEQAR